MSEYCLMNKDNALIRFSIMENGLIDDYKVVEIERYVGEDVLPPKFVDMTSWIDSRNYAKHKDHLRKWLKEWQIDNAKGFVDLTHALSLNDSLWVKPVDSDLSWGTVNLYSNDFTDVVAKTAFEKGLHGLKLSITSPEFTSEGSFEKCWIKEDDGIYLYKKGSSGFANAGLEMYSEYYATQYASVICDSYVSYDLCLFKDNIVSKCKMFTTEEEGFVPIYKYLNEDKKYDYEELLEFFETYGFDEDFRRMILLDSVILNEDRHFGNFGFIVNNDTYEVLRFAPVFDHNMSLLCRAMESDLTDDSEYIRSRTHKIGGDFVKVARGLIDEGTRGRIEKLIDIPIKRHSEFNLPEERIEFLDDIIQKHIRQILE